MLFCEVFCEAVSEGGEGGSCIEVVFVREEEIDEGVVGEEGAECGEEVVLDALGES